MSVVMQLLNRAYATSKPVLSWLAATFTVMVSIELTLQFVSSILTQQNISRVDGKIRHSTFQNEAWAPALFKEMYEVRLEYDQFLGWRSREFNGDCINIDNNGFRKTVRFTNDSVVHTDTILVFGGSSVWGVYVRDEYTIPSLLATLLHNRGRNPVVINCGERGYTFTQNVIQLVLLLRSGYRPSKVVFIDGCNDVYGAHRAGKAGLNGFVPEMDRFLQSIGHSYPRRVFDATTEWITTKSIIGRNLQRVADFVLNRKQADHGTAQYSNAQLLELSSAIIENYIASHTLLADLAARYKFDYYCFLQAMIYTKATLTEEERTGDPKLNDPQFKFLFQTFYDTLEHRSLSNVYSLGNVLDGEHETCFLDFCHVTERANRLIARKVFEVVLSH